MKNKKHKKVAVFLAKELKIEAKNIEVIEVSVEDITQAYHVILHANQWKMYDEQSVLSSEVIRDCFRYIQDMFLEAKLVKYKQQVFTRVAIGKGWDNCIAILNF